MPNTVGFTRRKKKKRIGRPAILRGRLQRRQAAKASGRQGLQKLNVRTHTAVVLDHNFFAALRLCEKKKKE
jgi:hypothetical protein